MEKEAKIYVAGHKGLVGSAIVRNLKSRGFNNLLFADHKDLDLTNQNDVGEFICYNRPDYIFLCAAKVGGIYANNTFPADFIYSNLQIQTNIIHWAYEFDVKKLLFLGSSCIYPKFAPQPMKEEYLLSGPLEPTNAPYAIAKIAGILMCQSYNRQNGTDFISVMPTNLYGPGDNYHPMNSHVLPALIRRFHEAKIQNLPEVTIWGTGQATREFLYSDDLADACVFLMEKYSGNEIVNIGSGEEVLIEVLAQAVKLVVDYKGHIIFDPSKPDGTPRKLIDSSKINSMGWSPKIPLIEGLKLAYSDFLRISKRAM